MAAQEPGQQPSLTALPRLEDLPRRGEGYDGEAVSEAFEAFRRHSAQLQAQLRVLQAASRSGQTVEPTGHAVRMDALHLIRSAAEFADTVEADAQRASEAQLAKTEEEVRRRRREQLDRGRVLGVALDLVRELGGSTDEVQRVHANGVRRRLDLRRPGSRLEHPQLRLQLSGMAPERVERLAHRVGRVAVAAAREILEPRERGQ
jgi:hypothetical protein